jgi:dihydrofolate reductase
MGKLSSYTFITLDGYFEGASKGDLSWHSHGQEESEYAAEGANSESTLLFGRVTFQQLASFWPTAAAAQAMPEVAKGMNTSEKIVFSRTITSSDWANTKVIGTDILEAVKDLKARPGKDLTILGSGSIVVQLARERLIDQFLLMIDPVLLGQGSSLFHNLNERLDLKLNSSRVFKSGVILLNYSMA